MHLTIFGSCVSRDIFRGDFFNGKDNIHILKYFARTSLISLNSQPLEIDISGAEKLNPFQKRLLSDDLKKYFYQYISSEKREGSWLLIDFLDERFHIVKWREHYFTRSNEYIRAGLPQRIPGEVLNRFNQKTTALWQKNCLTFIRNLLSFYPLERIILHKAFWKETYLDNGKIILFPKQDEISRQNRLLTKCYSFFESHCHGIRVLDVNNKTYHADKNHIWGLGEMHYEPGYYQDCMQFFVNLEKNKQ